MDRLDAMSILLKVVDTGSLSAASRQLGIPLATVSRKVSDLEAHLRVRLFTRSSRSLTLTDAGQSYVAACRRILEEVDEAERGATGEYSSPKGNLVVTAPIVFGRLHVLPVVLDFLEAYPEINIRMEQADRVVNMLEEHVDVAVRIGELPDSSLIARRVGYVRRVLCGSPAYFEIRGVPRSLEDLKQHDCVTFEGLTAPNLWRFAKAKADVSVRVHSRLTVNTAEAAIDAAIAGLGLTKVLSYQIADAVAAGHLKVVMEQFEPPPWPVSLVHGTQSLLPQKIRAFLDFCAPRLKAKLTDYNYTAPAN